MGRLPAFIAPVAIGVVLGGFARYLRFAGFANAMDREPLHFGQLEHPPINP
jgi:hypothetical protein